MPLTARLEEILNERDMIRKSASLHWLHWFVVIASLFLTLGAWQFTKLQVEERTKNQFEREANQIVELVSERLKKYEDTLWSGVAAIHAQERSIDYEIWKEFASALKIEERYSGINGIGVIYRLNDKNELKELTEKERQARPNFSVYPEHNNNEYWPIVYIEPMDQNLKAVGLDMAHEANRFEAAKKARDTGKAQITGPIILVQDQKQTPGFLFYAPFYNSHITPDPEERNEKFVGMVYAPFIMSKLMQGALEKEKRRVGVLIKDGNDLLYNETKYTARKNDEYHKTFTIDVYGRQWLFEIWAQDIFYVSNATHKPLIILIGGILIDAMLLAFFIFITRSNKRTLEFADRLAESYKLKNEELEDAENFQMRILENIPDLIFVKDEEFRIVKANKAFLELYPENKRHQVIGYSSIEDFDEHEAELFIKHDKEALDKGYSETVEKITFPNGSRQTLHTKKIGFEDNDGKKYVLGVAHNITDLKKAEEELINSNLELERFAYVAAHDMQEPARIVKSFAEILEEDYLDQLDDKGKVYLKECISGAKQIQDLINDLLEYSRLSNHSDSLEIVKMDQVTSSTLNNLSTLIEETKAIVRVPDKMPQILGNEMRCIRLMQNLISNAIKYQPDGQTPEVTIAFTEKDNYYLFSVTDNGIGIDEQYHKKIFEPFKKLHHHSKFKGTGIGLSICQKIIQTMKGKIWIESKIGKGSTFYFTLNKPENLE